MDSPGSRTRAKGRVEHRLADEARFIRTWFDKPKLLGAVSPSGRFLARVMADQVDPDGDGPIVELGPGTGPITEALLGRGVAAHRLTLVEFDRSFCRHLQNRFPGVRVVQGDAYALAKTLAGVIARPITAIVSSLPLLTKPEAQRLSLLGDAFDLMAPEGRFVQFTYGRASPVPCDAAAIALQAQVSPLVWLNLPPARVWVYQRQAAAEAAFEVREIVRRGGPDLFDRLRFHTERVQQDLKREFFAARTRMRTCASGRDAEAGHPAPAVVRAPDAGRIQRP